MICRCNLNFGESTEYNLISQLFQVDQFCIDVYNICNFGSLDFLQIQIWYLQFRLICDIYRYKCLPNFHNLWNIFPKGGMFIFIVLLLLEHKLLIRFTFNRIRTYLISLHGSCNPLKFLNNIIWIGFSSRNLEFEVINYAPTIRSLIYRIRNS